MSAIKALEDLIKEAKKLEEEGRRIAFRREEEIGEEAIRWFEEVREASYALGEFFDKLMGEEKWAGFAQRVGWAAYSMKENAKACAEWKEELGACCVSTYVKEDLKDVDKAYAKASGRTRCTWLLGVKKPYTLSAAVNDLTACFHRAIEKAEEFLRSWEREGKCMWRR